jgi:hypothetical protein
MMPQLYDHADPSERRVWYELQRMDRRLAVLEVVVEGVHARQVAEGRPVRQWIYSLFERHGRIVDLVTGVVLGVGATLAVLSAVLLAR